MRPPAPRPGASPAPPGTVAAGDRPAGAPRSDGPLPLRDVLMRVAEEARHVHDGLAGLDASLGGALGRLPPDLLVILQQTDLLRQEAQGLADFLHRLASDISDGAGCDPGPALDVMLLKDQLCRLSGISAGSASDQGSEIWAEGCG